MQKCRENAGGCYHKNDNLFLILNKKKRANRPLKILLKFSSSFWTFSSSFLTFSCILFFYHIKYYVFYVPMWW